MSESEGSFTIRFDKKLVVLFIVIMAAVASGLFLYNYLMKPTADTVVENTGAAIGEVRSSVDQASAIKHLEQMVVKRGFRNATFTMITREELLLKSPPGAKMTGPWTSDNLDTNTYDAAFYVKVTYQRPDGEIVNRVCVWKEKGKDSWTTTLFGQNIGEY
jgi:hypothetical protein